MSTLEQGPPSSEPETQEAETSLLLRALLAEPPPLKKSVLPKVLERVEAQRHGRRLRLRYFDGQGKVTTLLAVAILLALVLTALLLALAFGLLGARPF